MRNDLQIFENEEFGKVRTITIDGESWFVGKDVATALGYKDTSDALKRHVQGDDKLTKLINAVSRLMEHQGSEPYKVTENARLLCEEYGIQMIEDFVKIPEYQQLKFIETANRELAVK